VYHSLAYLLPYEYSFDFYDDKLCLDSFKLDTVLGRYVQVRPGYYVHHLGYTQ